MALHALYYQALRLPAAQGRRAAVASLTFGLVPAAAVALPAFDKGELEGLKPEKKKKRMKPDGFGGFVERDEEVKPVIARAIDGVTGGDEAPAPAPRAAAPAPAPTVSASTKSSASAPTLDELIAKSIAQKEELRKRTRPFEPMPARTAPRAWCCV